MRVALSISFLALWAAAGCCKHAKPADAKPSAPLLALTDSSGQSCLPLDASDGRRATVILFLMHDCPVANAMAPAMARLAAQFGPRGVRFYGVYATESPDEIAAHLKAFNLPFPGIHDPGMKLAIRAGASRVPEAAVFSPGGELLYRGRIDDRAISFGVTRPGPQREDLRVALESVLDGRRPEPATTSVVGCYLPVP